MLRTALLAIFALALLSSPASAFNMSNTSYKITDAVISSGGGISANTSYKLDMTLGQPIAGYSSNTSYKIFLGRVWSIISGVIESMQTGVQVDTGISAVSLGATGNAFIKISNGGPKSKEFPLHIGSFDQSRNWAWFTGHRTDEKRHDMNVTLGPYETRIITIDFFGAVPGKYTLIIGPDADYSNRYGEIPFNVVYKSTGLFSTTPDIGALAFTLAVLAAAIISSFPGRKSAHIRRK